MNRETFVGQATMRFELLVTLAALAGLVAVGIIAEATSAFVLPTAVGLGLLFGVITARLTVDVTSTRLIEVGAAVVVVAVGWWAVGTSPWLLAAMAWVLVGWLAATGFSLGRQGRVSLQGRRVGQA